MSYTAGPKRQIAMTLFTKETAYNGGTTINDTNGCELYGFDNDPAELPDQLQDNKDTIQGSEFATVQEIIRQAFTLKYSEPRVRPNVLAGLGYGALGSRTTAQDGGFTAYRHKLTPVAAGTAIPSFNVVTKEGTQWKYTGVVVKSLKLMMKDAGYVGIEAELAGSGSRATDSSTFPAKITESWIKTTQAKAWLEGTPANISIAGTPTQGSQNISSGTPADLKTRIRNFEWTWDNNLFTNYGFGSAVLQEAFQGAQRKTMASFTMLFNDDTELNYYLNQSRMAIEVMSAGSSVIAAGGAFYPGFDLILPACQLKPVGKKGKVSDYVTQDFEVEIMDDGTNPVAILYVYNAKALYLN